MKSAFLIFMIVVLVFTILLGILIWRQSFRIEKGTYCQTATGGIPPAT